MASSNFINVTSPQHFKDLLSADLNRVSCLNFWAPWAEPCAAFTKTVEGEATKFPSVLFLNVSLVQSCGRGWICPGLRRVAFIGPWRFELMAFCFLVGKGRVGYHDMKLDAMPCFLGMNVTILRTPRSSSAYANDEQIEAEELADISESFDIEAVPSFLLLRVSWATIISHPAICYGPPLSSFPTSPMLGKVGSPFTCHDSHNGAFSCRCVRNGASATSSTSFDSPLLDGASANEESRMRGGSPRL
jgi:thiol-disulfide isomerase/thioredoxin